MYALAIPVALVAMIIAGTVGADGALHLYQFFSSTAEQAGAGASWRLRVLLVICTVIVMAYAARLIYRCAASRGIPFR